MCYVKVQNWIGYPKKWSSETCYESHEYGWGIGWWHFHTPVPDRKSPPPQWLPKGPSSLILKFWKILFFSDWNQNRLSTLDSFYFWSFVSTRSHIILRSSRPPNEHFSSNLRRTVLSHRDYIFELLQQKKPAGILGNNVYRCIVKHFLGPVIGMQWLIFWHK